MAYPELQRRRMRHARQRQWRYAAVRALQRHLQPVGSMINREGALGAWVLLHSLPHQLFPRSICIGQRYKGHLYIHRGDIIIGLARGAELGVRDSCAM